MSPEQQLSRVLERLYASAGTPAEWPDLLEEAVAFAGGEVGQLIVGDPATKIASLATTTRNRDSLHLWTYIQEYGASDPRVPVMMSRLGRICRDYEMEPADFERSGIVNDFLNPFDLRRQMGVFFEADGLFGSFAIMRPRGAGHFTDEETGRFDLLIPHLQRSFALHRRLAACEAENGAWGAFASAFESPILLVDRTGRVLFANEAAEAMLARLQGGLRVRAGRLRCARPQDAEALAAALANVARAALGAEPLNRSHVVVVGGATAPEPLRLLVSPLPRAHPLAPLATASGAEAVVIGLGPRPGHGGGAALLAAAFGLTAAEARLAGQMARGATVDEAAERLRVSRNTVRTQLKALFDKTGTRRQTGLVRALQGCLSLSLSV